MDIKPYNFRSDMLAEPPRLISPRRRWSEMAFAFGIAGAVIFGVVAASWLLDDSTPSSNPVDLAGGAHNSKAASGLLRPMSVGPWAFQDGAIMGLATNNTLLDLRSIDIRFGLYNRSGQKVGTARDRISSLGPKEVWKFEAHVFERDAETAVLEEIHLR